MSRWLFALAVAGALVAVGWYSGRSIAGVEVALGAGLVALVLNVVVHELGHLVAALLLRLKVAGVRINPLGCGNAVRVAPSPSAPWLRGRLVAFLLAGPAVNLAVAGLAYQGSTRPMPTLARCALLAAALIGAMTGLGNLVPVRARGQRSDGAQVVRWVFRNAGARAELHRAHENLRSARARKSIMDGRVDAAGLRDIVDHERDPRVMLAAVQQYAKIGKDADQLAADGNRLLAIARDERTDPAVAAVIGMWLANLFGTMYLHAAIVDGQPLDQQSIDEVAEMGELAYRRLPQLLGARTGLALGHLLHRRPEQARTLLVGARRDPAQPNLWAEAMLIRAIAESYLGDDAQAARLVTAAAGAPHQALLETLTALRTKQGPPINGKRGIGAPS